MASLLLKLTLASVAAVAFISGSSAVDKVRYDGYKVFRATPLTREHVALLQELEKLGVIYFDDKPSRVNKHVDLLFPPHLQGDLLDHIKNFAGMKVEETIPNLQTLIDREVVSRSDVNEWTGWTRYHQFEDYMEFLQTQQTQHSDVATVWKIGESYEGRPLNVLRISTGNIPPKRAVWVDANIHAREWISGAVATYLIDQLLNSGTDEVKAWLNDFDFYIMPIANPDGFAYTTANRLWRKTRSNTTSLLGCKGADPNRNWGYKWLTGGSSNIPCDDIYAGPEAWSEPETKAMADFFHAIASEVDLFLSIHSFSQYIIFPYGLDDETLDEAEYAEYMEIGTKVANALELRHGTQFRVGSITDLLYAASGGSIDWIKAEYDTDLTFAFELRDQGAFGFLLPADQIIPSGEEFMDGMGAFIDELRARRRAKEARKV